MIPLKDRNVWIRILLVVFAIVPASFIFNTIQKGGYIFKGGLIVDKSGNPHGYYFGLFYMAGLMFFLLFCALKPNKENKRRVHPRV
jgi:hypothetical protein